MDELFLVCYLSIRPFVERKRNLSLIVYFRIHSNSN